MTKQTQKGKPHDEVKPEDLAKPDSGSWLTQHWNSWVSGQVTKLLGEFNPRAVNYNTYALMQLDPDVAFATAILRGPIINMRLKVTGRDPKISAFVEQALNPKYPQLATTMTNAMKWGWQVAEEILTARPFTISTQDKPGEKSNETKMPMAWVYDEFKSIDPRTLQLAVNPKTDKFWGVWQTQFGEMNLNTPPPVPASRVALWSFRKDDVHGKLQGFPVYDQMYSPWYAKIAMELYANRYFERRADPTLIGYGDDGSLVDEKGNRVDVVTFMLKLMSAIKQGTNAVLPAGFDDKGNRRFELKYLLDDKRGDMFQQRIISLGTQILRGAWITDRAGTTNGSDGGGGLGTGGEAQVHENTLERTLDCIRTEWLDQVVNPQVVDRLVLYNFGPEALAESQTRAEAGGMSAGQKDTLKELLFKLMDQEAALASGNALPIYQHFDAPGIAASLGAPLVSPEDLKALTEQHEKDRAEAKQMAQEAHDAAVNPDEGDGDGVPRAERKPKPGTGPKGKAAALDFLKKQGVTT